MPRLSNEELKTHLRTVLEDLEREIARPPASPSRRDSAVLERWLQLAIQICIDSADRILAARNMEEPPQAQEVFSALHEAGLFTSDLALAMRKLVGTRNALVHDYGGFTPQTTPDEVRKALPILARAADVLLRELP